MTLILPPSARQTAGLHPIFHEVCDPAATRHDLSSPWSDGSGVYATDGAILVWTPAARLAARVAASLASRQERRPEDMGKMIGQAPPTEDVPTPWPDRSVAPDVARARCKDCHGEGYITSVIYGAPARACKACGGRGHLSRAGVGVRLREAWEGGPGLGLDAWYLTLLRDHGAVLYATRMIESPKQITMTNIIPAKVGVWRFNIGDHITGFVQPFIC